MRRKPNTTSPIPETGKFIAYDRDAREWQGYYDGKAVIESASTSPEQTRAALDSYVYDLLKHQPAAA